MAIPKLYSILKKQWPDIIRNVHTDFKCDSLYLDMNSILHIYLNDATSVDNFFEVVTEYVGILIDLIAPTNLLFLAFDGVPPLAKLKSQAERRHTNSQNDKPLIIDHNALTPGTALLQELSSYIQTFIKEKLLPKHPELEVILSDSSVPSEGEHKLISHLRKTYSTGENVKSVIYGIDADLIALSLSLLNTDVSLIRESHTYKSRPTGKTFEILDVNRLKYHFLEGYLSETKEQIGADLILLDILLILSIIGNDFLPMPSGLAVDITTLRDLLTCLRKYHSIHKVNIVSRSGNINEDSFEKLLVILDEFDLTKFKTSYPIKKTSLETKILELQLSGLSLKDRKSIINDTVHQAELEHFEEWKMKRYSKELSLKPLDQQKFFSEYIRGLKWLLRYYLDDCPCWNWLNEYSIAPYLSDFKKGLKGTSADFETGSPILPLHQLSLVLPRKSRALLPELYRNSDKYDRFSSILLNSPAPVLGEEIRKQIRFFQKQIDPKLKMGELERNTISQLKILRFKSR